MQTGEEKAAAGSPPGPAQHTVTVGLVSDPGLPTELAARLAQHLVEDLRRHVDSEVRWEVRVRCETMPLNSDGELPLHEHSRRLLAEHHWDYLVCLTELPRRAGIRPLLYDVLHDEHSALLSVPALGLVRLRPHARWALVRVLRELAGGAPQRGYGGAATGAGARLRGRLAVEALSPVREVPGAVETHAALAGLRGQLRLLAGMVRVNRPWRLVPSLSSAIAAAVATGAFGVFYSSIWGMADAADPVRLTLVTLFAVVAMVGWLLFQNDLWEVRGPARDGRGAALYNTATVLTLVIGVLCMYVLLFTFTLLASLVVIEPDYLARELRHPVGLWDYVVLAWLASSMGTVAGAIGSTLEGEDSVRRATYGRRELERRARREQSEGEDGHE